MATHLGKGIELHQRGNIQEAVKEYEKSLNSSDEKIKVEATLRHLAIAYYDLKDYNTALKYMNLLLYQKRHRR